jgi:hypothetical protein
MASKSNEMKIIAVSKLVIIYIAIASCKQVQYYKGSSEINLKSKESFYIQFTDGYDYDTISLKINDIQIFTDKVHKSVYSRSLEPVPDSILMVDKNTLIKYDNDTLYLKILGIHYQPIIDFQYSPIIKIELVINSKTQKEALILSKGRYINIPYLYKKVNESSFEYRAAFWQYKGLPISY